MTFTPDELAQIAEHIATRGVTRLPPPGLEAELERYLPSNRGAQAWSRNVAARLARARARKVPDGGGG